MNEPSSSHNISALIGPFVPQVIGHSCPGNNTLVAMRVFCGFRAVDMEMNCSLTGFLNVGQSVTALSGGLFTSLVPVLQIITCKSHLY